MDPRILFVRNSGRGQLQKPPPSLPLSLPACMPACLPVCLACLPIVRPTVIAVAFLAPGKGYDGKGAPRRGGQIFFYILDPGRSFFYEPFFPAVSLSLSFSRARAREEPRNRGSHSRSLTAEGPFAQLSPSSLRLPLSFSVSPSLLVPCSSSFSWPRERIALDLLSGCDREREHACVIHAFPIHGRTDAPP